MARPRLDRHVSVRPVAALFKPGGVRGAEQLLMSLDELEAIRLSDVEALRQGAAAARMRVSRPTYGRIVRAARRKLALALVRGYTLRIAGASSAARCRSCPGSCDDCARCAEPLVQLGARRG
ncbi:MAG: DUF134 domain-containing protein [Anaeromyxobacter sp.]